MANTHLFLVLLSPLRTSTPLFLLSMKILKKQEIKRQLTTKAICMSICMAWHGMVFHKITYLRTYCIRKYCKYCKHTPVRCSSQSSQVFPGLDSSCPLAHDPEKHIDNN